MTTLRSPARAAVRRPPAPMHRGDADHRCAPAARRMPRLTEPAMCERCGAVYLHKTWRRGRRRLAFTPPIGVKWTVCPACRQVATGEAYGRVILRGPGVAQIEDAVRLDALRADLERAVARGADHDRPASGGQPAGEGQPYLERLNCAAEFEPLVSKEHQRQYQP